MSQDLLQSASALRQALRQARQQAAQDGGASANVWERMLALCGDDAQALQQSLQQHLGVRVVRSVAELRDWRLLEQQPPPGSRATAVHALEPGAAGCVLCADPWEPALSAWADGLQLSKCLASADVLTALGRRTADGASHPSAVDVVGFVDQVLQDAFEQGASDIHFEVTRAGLVVKLRLDGVLSELARLPEPQRAAEVVSRLKVLASLDITEQRIPQDGRLRLELAGRQVDLRASVMPSIFGEDVVLRLLDKSQLRTGSHAVTMSVLGLDAASEDRLRELCALPHGMTLITGPTGSGKTTTVYAVLSEVNDGSEKIVTIEDPVEYELGGVLQIPVNERKGLTFAKGLRSILRHDPDRILVGEIRDAETAEIAVQSALTGHQVFTTVHANSIYDVTGRFRHFGLDMFGFMASLNAVVVQRLVRRLCDGCKRPREATAVEQRWLSDQGRPLAQVLQPGGCDQCRGTGFKGRIAVAEVHAVDDGLRDLVVTNAPLTQLREHIRKSGVASLAQRGAQLIAEGQTTPQEVKRVVGW